MSIRIVASGTADLDVMLDLHRRVFPEEDLCPLVHALLTKQSGVLALSATMNDNLVGTVIFTPCHIAGRTEAVGLLGPLAVAPEVRRQGLGRQLVEEGLGTLAADGVAEVYVLGNPAFYGRLGFIVTKTVTPPYPLPPDWQTAWQARRLNGSVSVPAGALVVPAPWRDPALWGP